MINIIKYSQENGIQKLLPEDFKKWDYKCKENLWIDIYNAPAEESQEILKNCFNFHPLAIEDALKHLTDDSVHHPKIDDFDSYLFIVFNGLIEEEKSFKYQIFSLSCFLGHNFLITIHNEGSGNTVFKNLNSFVNERSFKKGPDYILNLILDEIVDRYYPILDSFETEIDDVEEELFEGTPGNKTLQRILNLKKELIKLRRISAYQKEVLFKLTRGDSELISSEESAYYRNVYDHLVRVSDTTESYRDYVAGMLDSYLSIVNNKMNEVMKFLTIIATMILPMTLITGIFGMNFDVIPFLHNDFGFWISVISMATIVIVMLIWFKHKKWI
ncbi:MAG: magnesium/cobalt transporter CorA [Bacteroidota bacterium]|nr:magnesium/cobalt transporter CorA [Bacteroidota bacterium]